LTESAEPLFTCDLGRSGEELPHFWEHTVGSGHAALALRADWQAQMARCRRELGFRRVRFHGLLDDEMGTLSGEKGKPVYSFFNADCLWDFLLAIDMRPFVELSFMPTTLASGSTTVFHYRANVTPPTRDAEWEALIQKLARHWLDRYGAAEVEAWLFEVWNEPNLTAFWTGAQRDYFQLYRATARALKGVNPSLSVGGPATAMNAWIEEFLDFCANQDVPADFVSTHHYPTDAFGMPGDDTETQLAESRRSVLREQARTARRQAGHLPLYYTEWSSSSNPFDELHDRPYAAAFLVKTVMEAAGLVEGYSWWTFTDLFGEHSFPSVPFHGGFGLLNIHGIPKPTYRAFQVLHGLGNERLTVDAAHPTVDAWVVRKAEGITVLLTNWALPRHPIATERVVVRLTGASRPASAFVTRLDEDHANPRKRWEEMGKPEPLTTRHAEDLQAASSLTKEPLPVEFADAAISFAIALPPQSVAAVSLSLP
jgi:xylan 1,4-beta-xylosidase